MISARSRQPAGTRLALALLLALTLVIPALGTPAPALAAPQVDYYGYDLSDMFGLGGFTAGPDGAQWFTNSNGNTASQIGRLNTAGEISAIGIFAAGILLDLAQGPDGNLWATARHFYTGSGRTDWIVRITPQLAITSYPLPNPDSIPEHIVAGPDGALWFTESVGNRIGRITTSGAITEYAIPTTSSAPTGITAGADGALWFTEKTGNRIARITTTGTITELPLLDPDSAPAWITNGPDGRIWFSDQPHRRLGAIATGSTMTYYPLTIPPIAGNPGNAGPEALTAGPDGNLWVLMQQTHQIWRISTSGAVVATIGLPFPDSPLINIAPGPDGRIWYGTLGRIGAITVAGQVTQWDYGTFVRTTILPTDSGTIWLVRQRDVGAPDPRLERIGPKGFIDRLPIAGLPAGARLSYPVLGPDDTIWCFVVMGSPGNETYALGHIAANGTIATTPLSFADHFPRSLLFGPDGNLWSLLRGPGFGSGSYTPPYNLIARLTPGGQLTTFPVEDAFGTDSALPAGELTAGTDGNLWFIGTRSNQIHRITPAGQITDFTIGSNPPSQYLSLGLLTSVPGGDIWFSAYISTFPQTTDRVLGKLTPGGQVTFFPLETVTQPGSPGMPTSLLAGPDGNPWFTMDDRAVFHSITPDGRITDLWLNPNATIYATRFIAATADSLWFNGPVLGRIHLPATSSLTTQAVGNGSVVAGGTYPTGEIRSLSATPGAGGTFVGWRVDGVYRGWSNTLPVWVIGPTAAEAIFVPTTTFADLPGDDPTTIAARELATRGIMEPLAPQRCQQLGLASPCFGAIDPLTRTQGALMLAQSVPAGLLDVPGIGPLTWRDVSGPISLDTGQPPYPFLDPCTAQQECVPDEEWQTITYLRFNGVAKGYDYLAFRPFDPLLNVHTISLISRAMVANGYWQPQHAAPDLFAGSVPAIHADDVATYLHYVGSLPDAPGAGAAWDGWLQPSTRGWFARAFWAALDSYWSPTAP